MLPEFPHLGSAWGFGYSTGTEGWETKIRQIEWPGLLLSQPGALVNLPWTTLAVLGLLAGGNVWTKELTFSRGAASLAQTLGDSATIVQLRNENHCCSIWDLQAGDESTD